MGESVVSVGVGVATRAMRMNWGFVGERALSKVQFARFPLFHETCLPLLSFVVRQGGQAMFCLPRSVGTHSDPVAFYLPTIYQGPCNLRGYSKRAPARLRGAEI